MNECIALAEKLSLGLADNEAFWSWIARHSPLVREKAWFKRETLKELGGEVQDKGEGGEGGKEGDDGDEDGDEGSDEGEGEAEGVDAMAE